MTKPIHITQFTFFFILVELLTITILILSFHYKLKNKEYRHCGQTAMFDKHLHSRIMALIGKMLPYLTSTKTE
jgi:hypothetical protein